VDGGPVRGKILLSRSLTAPLAASLLIHAAVVTALFTLSFPDGIAEPPQPARVVILIDPVPLAMRRAVPAAPEMPQKGASSARRFVAPALLAVVVPPDELPVPSIDLPRPVLPLLAVQPIAAVPAPPLRTDNFLAPMAVAHVTPPAAVVQMAGFSTAIPATQRRPPLPISLAGFGDASVTTPVSVAARTGAPLPLTRTVEILSKPTPAYTEEARLRHVEGEVLLEIVFSASGQVHVLRIVRGLGYGLDESAMAAAETIRFRPAERAGVAADSTAIVHIAFQLAY
jgi:protein TonB